MADNQLAATTRSQKVECTYIDMCIFPCVCVCVYVQCSAGDEDEDIRDRHKGEQDTACIGTYVIPVTARHLCWQEPVDDSFTRMPLARMNAWKLNESTGLFWCACRLRLWVLELTSL